MLQKIYKIKTRDQWKLQGGCCLQQVSAAASVRWTTQRQFPFVPEHTFLLSNLQVVPTGTLTAQPWSVEADDCEYCFW